MRVTLIKGERKAMKMFLISLVFSISTWSSFASSEAKLDQTIQNGGDAVVFFYSFENEYARELFSLLQMMGISHFGFNTLSHPALTHGWGVKSTPALFFVNKGKISTNQGPINLEELKDILE
jgi:hypothetical protein